MSVITTHPNYPAYVNADGIWVVGVDFSGPPPGDIVGLHDHYRVYNHLYW